MLEKIEQFKNYLINEEKAEATVNKYVHDVALLYKWLGNRELCKEAVREFKAYLEKHYTATSVNTMLSSLNSFFDWHDCPEYKVKNLKIQKNAFIAPSRDLSKEEYERLLQTALDLGKNRIYYVMQTICATGIRVSELKYITVEAVKKGVANVKCKGKSRIVYIPQLLIKMLLEYIKEAGVNTGSIFVTRNGRPLDRTNIWSEMKKLCEKAGVLASKVFPHNLRHLFGKTYYEKYQDVVRLADILGHESVDTTRIYTAESGEVHRKRIQDLGLVFDMFQKIMT